MRDRAKSSAALAAILLAAAMMPQTGEAGKKDKPKGPLEETFPVKEAGIELTLTDDWFPQTALPDKKITRMLTSLKDLSQIRITQIPFQVDMTEASFQERLGEFITSVRTSHPEFEITSSELIPGDPARLHVEGSWIVEKRPVQVLMEVFPAKARTIVVTLTTQKTGRNKFRFLADLIKTRLIVKDKPLPAPFPATLETTQGGARVRIEPPAGWRPALQEEIEFLAAQMADEGLYEESSSLSGELALVRPSLQLISSTVTFRSSKGVVPVSAENRPRFEALYASHLAASGGSFKVGRVTIETIGGISTFMVEGTTQRTGFSVRSRQYFIPAAKETIIITLSAWEDEAGWTASGTEEILRGMTFELNADATKKSAQDAGKQASPSPRGVSRYIPWGIGGLALVMLLAILVLRFRSRGRAKTGGKKTGRR